ncbi:MAG: transcriptional repressor [Marmoricola sp.]
MTSTEPYGVPSARPTRQRRAIAAAFDQFDDFRSAQDIHALLASRGEGRLGHGLPHPSSNGGRGAIDSLLTDSGESVYRRCSGAHHHHLVCRECGATQEVAGPAAEAWTRSIASAHGFADLTHRIEITGICPSASDPQAPS